MEVFRQLLEDARGVWREMTTTQRAAVGTLVITVAALLAFVVWLGGGNTAEKTLLPLPIEVDAKDAPEIIKELEAGGFGPVQYSLESRRIEVPIEKSREAILHLANSKVLPTDRALDFEALLDKWAFSDTRDKSEEMKRVARSNEMGRLIERLAIVREAKVIYSDNVSSSLFRAPVRPHAAVSVTCKTGKTLDQRTADTIIRLVAAAKAGLEPKDVMVTDQSGRHFTSEDTGSLDSIGLKKHEDEMRRKEEVRREIEVLCRAAVAGSEVWVFPDFKVDYDTREMHSTEYTEGPKAHSNTEKQEMRQTKAPAAETGTRPNIGRAADLSSGMREETTEKRTRADNTYMPGKKETLVKSAPEVKALTISAVIQLPYEYRKDEKGVWIPELGEDGKPLQNISGQLVRKKFSAKDMTDEQKLSLEKQIRAAAGMLTGQPNMEVAILTTPFPEAREFPEPPPPQILRIGTWLRENATPMFMLGVVLIFGYFVYRQAAHALPSEDMALPDEEPLSMMPEITDQDKAHASFEALRGQVASAVAENPGKAAALLRKWMKRDAYS